MKFRLSTRGFFKDGSEQVNLLNSLGFVLKTGKRGVSVVSGPEVEIKTLKEFVDFIKKTNYDCIVKVLSNDVCELELFDNFEEK